MNQQQLFDKVVASVLAQGEMATVGEGMCALRGENNTKCVIGHLITDEHYSADLEGINFPFSEEVKAAVSRSHPGLLTDANIILLSGLQVAHDIAASGKEARDKSDLDRAGEIKAFRKEAREMAAIHGLETTVLESR